jgi:uncharacterized protein
VIRVECHDIYPNCPRYVPNLTTGERSLYCPRQGETPPAPEWKSLPTVAPLLPRIDPRSVADHGWSVGYAMTASSSKTMERPDE